MTDDSVRRVLRDAEAALANIGIATARLDAELLLAHVLKCPRLSLYSRVQGLSDVEISAYDVLLKRRLSFEPVAYITGEQEFWSLPFYVTPAVLIPRPDTETLVEVVLARQSASNVKSILDLGTGSGCILLSLLSEYKDAQGQGADLSKDALAVAQKNAEYNALSDRVRFIESNWFGAVVKPVGCFDVIVSNPPYIRTDEMPGLMQDVRDFEPHLALEGGADGLAPYRLIADSAPDFLARGGLLAVETGLGQTTDVANYFKASGLQNIEINNDLSGHARVVSGKKQ